MAIDYRMDVKVAFNVSRKSFVPAPNVDSAIVVLTQKSAALPVSPFNEDRLFGLIRGCFAHRRKSLWNNLKTIVGKDEDRLGKVKEVLDRLEIDSQTRPERLSLVDFINLANAMHEKELL